MDKLAPIPEIPQDIIALAGEVCRGLGIASTPTNCDPIIRGLLAERRRSAAVTPEIPDWRTMDSAPKDGTSIIGRTDPDDVFACQWFWDDEGKTKGDWLMYGTDVIRPREWLPMPPAAPLSGAGKGE